MAFTGQKSDAAIAVATLMLTTLFTPIKNKLQAFVDKHFKESPDPLRLFRELDKDVTAVSQVLDVRALTGRLLTTAVDACKATGGALSLMHEDHLHTVHTYGDWKGEAAYSTIIESAGAQLGVLSLGPRRDGTEYSPKEIERLQASVQEVARMLAFVRKVE